MSSNFNKRTFRYHDCFPPVVIIGWSFVVVLVGHPLPSFRAESPSASPTKWAPKAEPCRAKVGEAFNGDFYDSKVGCSSIVGWFLRGDSSVFDFPQFWLFLDYIYIYTIGVLREQRTFSTSIQFECFLVAKTDKDSAKWQWHPHYFSFLLRGWNWNSTVRCDRAPTCCSWLKISISVYFPETPCTDDKNPGIFHESFRKAMNGTPYMRTLQSSASARPLFCRLWGPGGVTNRRQRRTSEEREMPVA